MNKLRPFFTYAAKPALLAAVAVGAISLGLADPSFAQGKGNDNAGGSQGANSGGTNSGGANAGGSDTGGFAGSGPSTNAGGERGGNDRPAPTAEEDEGDGPPDGVGNVGGSRPTETGRPEGTGGKPEGVGGGDTDSDQPDWAGTPGGSAGRGEPPNSGSGGDTYGDLFVILRDSDGNPILNEDGYVQPIDENGNLIPLDDEGNVIDESLVVEVDIGRLNISRAPDDVLEGRSEEVLLALTDPNLTDVSLDPAGRLVLTTTDPDTGDVTSRTIDAPLENLSIYVALMEYGSIEGVGDLPGDALDFLVDGVLDTRDLEAAASFLAAASDKADPLTLDEIAYIDLILDINVTTAGTQEVAYSDIDYSSFSYDRADTYGEVTATILVPVVDEDTGETSWVVDTVNIYETVFDSTNDDATAGTLEDFTAAADDARTVINYIHEYAVPVAPEDL